MLAPGGGRQRERRRGKNDEFRRINDDFCIQNDEYFVIQVREEESLLLQLDLVSHSKVYDFSMEFQYNFNTISIEYHHLC